MTSRSGVGHDSDFAGQLSIAGDHDVQREGVDDPAFDVGVLRKTSGTDTDQILARLAASLGSQVMADTGTLELAYAGAVMQQSGYYFETAAGAEIDVVDGALTTDNLIVYPGSDVELTGVGEWTLTDSPEFNAPLRVTGGLLHLNGVTADAAVAVGLELSGGALQLTGSSSLGAGMSIQQLGAVQLQGTGDLLVQDGQWQIAGDHTLSHTGTPSIDVAEQIVKTSGSGTATIDADLQGAGVDAQAGSVDLDYSGSETVNWGAATFDTEATETIRFLDGAHTIGATTFGGAGSYELSGDASLDSNGATMTLNRPFSVVAGATMLGTWTLAGSVDPELGTATIGAAGDGAYIDVPQGMEVIQSGDVTMIESSLNLDGTWSLDGDHSIMGGSLSSIGFEDDGVLRKSSGSGTSTVDVQGTPGAAGVISAQTGTLVMDNPGGGAVPLAPNVDAQTGATIRFVDGGFQPWGWRPRPAGRRRCRGGQCVGIDGRGRARDRARRRHAQARSGRLRGRRHRFRGGTGTVDFNGGAMNAAGPLAFGSGITAVASAATAWGTRDITNDGMIDFTGNHAWSGTAFIANNGAIRRSATGAGTSTIDLEVTNTGELEALGGTLHLTNGAFPSYNTGAGGGAADGGFDGTECRPRRWCSIRPWCSMGRRPTSTQLAAPTCSVR